MVEGKIYDCIIIGAGPGGLQAAIYMGRYRRDVLLIDRGGGRTYHARHIENFLSQKAISGKEIIAQHSRPTYLEINNAQGHGVVRGIEFALVISPFVYAKEMQAGVRRRIAEVNREMKARAEKYIMLVPGRLGSKNPDWGIFVEYQDVDQAAAIFEYGVDVAGRAEPLTEEENLTGGTYGSHFLYMIQGGFDEDQKRLQTRMYGTQGTHFLTNQMSNNVIYRFIMPMRDVSTPGSGPAPGPKSCPPC